jgi:hypothetical protein
MARTVDSQPLRLCDLQCDMHLHTYWMQVAEDAARPEGQRQFLLAELGNRVRIVLSAPNMQAWTLRFAHDRPVSVDCTFDITRYGYAVFTITGMDGASRDVPLAFAVLNSEAEEDFVASLQAWRDQVRKHRPEFQPSVFLSDDSQAEQNAIKYASAMLHCMGVSRP